MTCKCIRLTILTNAQWSFFGPELGDVQYQDVMRQRATLVPPPTERLDMRAPKRTILSIEDQAFIGWLGSA
jgi:hypothetical protein